MSAPLRVLTVARWYPSHDGPGRGTFVADLVDATVVAGVEARVVSFDRLLVRGRLEARDSVLVEARAACQRVATPDALFVAPTTRGARGVPVARLPVVRRPGSGEAAELVDDHLAALRPFVANLVTSWRPDVIHAHTGLPDGIVAATVGRELGIPVVVSEHASTIEADLAEPTALDRYRTLLEPGVRLLAVSPPVAERVARLLGVPPDTISVIPNPVDDASFSPIDASGRDPDELLWVGALGQHKGIDTLLGAVAQLRPGRPKLHLRLVGGERMAGDIARWRALADELRIGDAIAFDGWLDRRGVAAAMARARAFVHPSPSETFGVAAAEAILSGLPVATRRSGGVPWVVELSGGFGAVASDDDISSFAAAIEAVLGGRLAVPAEEARARLVAAVGTVAVATQVLGLYREVATATGDARTLTASASRHAPTVAPTSAAPASSPSAVMRPGAIPWVLVATEREQSIPRAAALPDGLRQRVVLVLPSRVDGASAVADDRPAGAVRLVEAAPARHERPPAGRGPVARFKRATWRPPPTADEELGIALRSALADRRPHDEPVDVVALDAPAAVLLAGLDPRRVRLAPGSLRWLADRWDADRTSGD